VDARMILLERKEKKARQISILVEVLLHLYFYQQLLKFANG
jgi:hypothetical protein